MRLEKIGQLTGLFALLLATTVVARAASPTEQLLEDRFNVDLGTYLVSSNINGSLIGAATTTNQSIDVDRRFGTDDANESRWRAEILWRMTRRQYLRFMYFDNDVTKTQKIDRNLEWGDYTFLGGGALTSENKLRVYELDYEFAFLRRDNYEVVASAGIHFDDVTLKLSGDASLTVDTPQGPVQQAAT